MVKAARKAVDDGEYTWAAEILTNVIRIDHDDMEARRLKAEAYRQFDVNLTMGLRFADVNAGNFVSIPDETGFPHRPFPRL